MIFKSFEEEQKEMQLNMYRYILEGKQKSFPSGYWEEEGDEYQFKEFLQINCRKPLSLDMGMKGKVFQIK